jgi:hypothetical protein
VTHVPFRLARIVSGGQTGVDRAALDVALALGIAHGGWCPRGRRAEDGRIPDRYDVREHESPDYAARTERNVIDSDATLVLTVGAPEGGTALTVRLADRHARPCLVVDLDDPPPPASVVAWLRTAGVGVLNVAGPRESTCAGISGRAAAYLDEVLTCAARSEG